MTSTPSSDTPPAPRPPRIYEAHAETTSTFGRVAARVRQHELTIDGPIQNGCPGEAPTPGELLLAAAAACGAEVIQVLAREAGVPLDQVAVEIRGTIDQARQPHEHVTVFSTVDLLLRLRGPNAMQAAALVQAFQRRCPVYGSLAVASGSVQVEHATEPINSGG